MHPWNQPILDSLRARLARLPHAILLHGPRGVGKLELAERMAQLFLCEHADPKQRPCDKCDACRWFVAGNHPDLRRIEPEAIARTPAEAGEEEGSEPPAREPSSRRKQPSIIITVDQIRELADFLNIRSHRGGLRIALVHPAEEMNPNAANALLKGLEEPPPGATFILVSHRPARLLPTVRSRCVALPVPIPPHEVAISWLKDQAAQDPERWLAFAGGAPLQALAYAEDAAAWDRLLKSPGLVDGREDLERLAEALQKIAYDRAFSAFGLPQKYRTGGRTPDPSKALAWLRYARQMGENRMLSRHPLNPRLFSAEMLTGLPKP